MKFKYPLYQKHSNYILGFHACDKSVADLLLNSNMPNFKISDNEYDWLGNGMYFWENDPNRALEFSLQKQKWKPNEVTEPTIIGAVIDLGNCINFLENQNINNLKQIYQLMKQNKGYDLPKNTKSHEKDDDYLLRYLDKAVIEFLVESIEKQKGFKVDCVKGMFKEGKPLYDNSGFYEKSHIQIAVRNPNMIKGYFMPIEQHDKHQ